MLVIVVIFPGFSLMYFFFFFLRFAHWIFSFGRSDCCHAVWPVVFAYVSICSNISMGLGGKVYIYSAFLEYRVPHGIPPSRSVEPDGHAVMFPTVCMVFLPFYNFIFTFTFIERLKYVLCECFATRIFLWVRTRICYEISSLVLAVAKWPSELHAISNSMLYHVYNSYVYIVNANNLSNICIRTDNLKCLCHSINRHIMQRVCISICMRFWKWKNNALCDKVSP